LYPLNILRINARKWPLVFISAVAGLVILSWGAASSPLALIGWHPKSMYIRKKAIENWAFIRDMAFYLIELAAGWFWLAQIGLAAWYIILPHIHTG